MRLKDTLNLPDPEFTIPMKADLPELEPRIQAMWDEQDIYGQIQALRADATQYVLHDGPPYTNGPIHLGTAENKIIKDFVLKSRTLAGYRVPYVPGYDNHGLPIEQAVMKSFEERNEQPDMATLRKACRAHAQRFIDLQTRQFKRLGILGLWERPYRTMDFKFEAEIVRVFGRLVQKGYVYRGLRPTLWSPSVRTALADTEIVYKDVTSKAATIAFRLKDAGPAGSLGQYPDLEALIWTTTPWTIPANLALAFLPEGEYVVFRAGGRTLTVIKERLEHVLASCGFESHEIVGTVKGLDCEHAVFEHPIYGRHSLGVLADYVTTEDGTGIVHTAPGHGRDDFYTGAKYGLPVLCPVDATGHMTDEAGEFAGLFYKKCTDAVLGRLKESGALLAEHDYRHSYPHAERDDMPVIFRATEQWFVSVDHEDLRGRMLDAIDNKVVWHPPVSRNRIRSMVSGRPDWCVSRQRPWGVGVPVFYGLKSGEPVLEQGVIERVATITESEGSDAWFVRPIEELLPPGYVHPQTGETEFRKETDVFDVWFDSGSTSAAVLEGRVDPEWKAELPVDLYFEGSDQHRGWFNQSLVIGMALRGSPPFKTVVTHGFVMDASGQKMSKRLGNSVDPVEVCGKVGADVLRYWAASVDFTEDAPCSDDILRSAGEHYRGVRNTLRFLLGNLFDYKPVQTELSGLDAWIVAKSEALGTKVMGHYMAFEFNEAIGALHNFCANEVSRVYADYVKDCLYCDAPDAQSRRAVQSASLKVLDTLVKLLAPVLPHTAEETYSKLPRGGKLPSVLMESWAPVGEGEPAAAIESALKTREWFFAELEAWRNSSGVKDSQDAHATVSLPKSEYDHVLASELDTALFFKVAGVELKVGERNANFAVSTWDKCDRSRVRRADVSPAEWHGEHVMLSARDRLVLGL